MFHATGVIKALKGYTVLSSKMLVKLTSVAFVTFPSVNFINVLWAAFAPVDPKSVKRYWQLDWILMLLGATGVKAVRKYVGEIDS